MLFCVNIIDFLEGLSMTIWVHYMIIIMLTGQCSNIKTIQAGVISQVVKSFLYVVLLGFVEIIMGGKVM